MKTIKAKCPMCTGGCNYCDNTDFVNMKLAEGLYYALCCRKCNCIIGGYIAEDSVPPTINPDGSDPSTCFRPVCPTCPDPQDLVWELQSYVDEDSISDDPLFP